MAKAGRHPLSFAWPDMPDADFKELVADIKANGCREPVVLLDGMILDGWHRACACKEAGIKIPTRPFNPALDGTPRAFVDSRNGHRRNITPVQRAAGFAATAAWEHEAHGAPPPSPVAIAQDAGVSPRTAKNIVAAVNGGLGPKLLSGELSAKAAGDQARTAKDGLPRKAGKLVRPEKPPKVSRDQQRIIDLELEVADLKRKNDELIAELQSVVDASGTEKEQQVRFQQLYNQINGLESQRDEWMQKCNAWQKEAMGLRKRLGER